MVGEDKAASFLGSNLNTIQAFDCLKQYINDICPDAVISIQGSLLAFRTAAGFAYISLPQNAESSVLFTLAVTNRKKLASAKIDKVIETAPGLHSYVYHISIKSTSDIDAEVKSLIRQSYEYSKLHIA